MRGDGALALRWPLRTAEKGPPGEESQRERGHFRVRCIGVGNYLISRNADSNTRVNLPHTKAAENFDSTGIARQAHSRREGTAGARRWRTQRLRQTKTARSATCRACAYRCWPPPSSLWATAVGRYVSSAGHLHAAATDGKNADIFLLRIARPPDAAASQALYCSPRNYPVRAAIPACKTRQASPMT